MLEPHAPHEPIHTWKDFLIHIGAIAVGLLLALGLEQCVEYAHHAHQRAEIEERIATALETDLRINADNFAQMHRFRAYMSALRASIAARIDGVDSPAQPPLRDARVALFVVFPGLAPYEAARSNGTVALLRENRIRLYNRISFAREVMLLARDRFFADVARLEGFQQRYVDSAGILTMNAVTSAVDIRVLSKAELIEYRERVGEVIAAFEELRSRMDLFDLEIRSLVGGATTETQLIEESLKARPAGFGVDREGTTLR